MVNHVVFVMNQIKLKFELILIAASILFSFVSGARLRYLNVHHVVIRNIAALR